MTTLDDVRRAALELLRHYGPVYLAAQNSEERCLMTMSVSEHAERCVQSEMGALMEAVEAYAAGETAEVRAEAKEAASRREVMRGTISGLKRGTAELRSELDKARANELAVRRENEALREREANPPPPDAPYTDEERELWLAAYWSLGKDGILPPIAAPASVELPVGWMRVDSTVSAGGWVIGDNVWSDGQRLYWRGTGRAKPIVLLGTIAAIDGNVLTIKPPMAGKDGG